MHRLPGGSRQVPFVQMAVEMQSVANFACAQEAPTGRTHLPLSQVFEAQSEFLLQVAPASARHFLLPQMLDAHWLFFVHAAPPDPRC
jgi:hypothetical protein